jgi:hypothetical protein
VKPFCGNMGWPPAQDRRRPDAFRTGGRGSLIGDGAGAPALASYFCSGGRNRLGTSMPFSFA